MDWSLTSNFLGLFRLQHFHALCVSTPYRVLKYVTMD
ncbi:hypothetical protein Gotur_002424, partial [Gossypium turneri]